MVGDRCRHWGEESGKKSTVGDQKDKQEWKRWTAPRQRHASPGNLTNRDYLTQTLRNTHCQKEIQLLPEDWISTSSTFFGKTRVQYYFGPSVNHSNDENDMWYGLNAIQEFSIFSSLEVNKTKSHATWLGSNKNRMDTFFGFNWKKKFLE